LGDNVLLVSGTNNNAALTDNAFKEWISEAVISVEVVVLMITQPIPENYKLEILIADACVFFYIGNKIFEMTVSSAFFFNVIVLSI
jgi:hypothetical protein